MTPYTFGQKLAESRQPGIQKMPEPIPRVPKPAAPPPPAAAPKPPTRVQSALQTGGNMLNNSARVGTGMLSTLAGGVGTAGTGLAAGATNVWNALTPKSLNTSPEFAQGVNNAFNKSVEFTNAGAQDVYGGLGGNQEYGTNKSWDVMQQGLNSMPQNTLGDKALSAAANLGAYGGNAMWNLAQAVPAGMTAAQAIPAAVQYGKNLATNGMNLARAGVNAVRAPVDFVKNTFKPGFGELRNSLRNTARVYSQQPGSIVPYRSPTRTRGSWANRTPDAPYGHVPPVSVVRNGVRSLSGDARLADTTRNSAGGMYFGDRDVATSLFSRGTAEGREIMRHELAHGLQANTGQANSLQGMIQSLRNSPGNWRQAAGHMLAEVNSNAAQAKTIPQQISNGWKFLTDPNKAKFYSDFYSGTNFGPQYSMLHNGTGLALDLAELAGYGGSMGAAGYGGYQAGNAMSPWSATSGE